MLNYLTSTYTMTVATFALCMFLSVIFGGIIGIMGLIFAIGVKRGAELKPIQQGAPSHPWTPEERVRQHATKGTYFEGGNKGGGKTHGA